MSHGVVTKVDGVVIRNRVLTLGMLMVVVTMVSVVVMAVVSWLLRDAPRPLNVHHPVLAATFSVLGVGIVVGVVLSLRCRTILTTDGIDDRWYLARRSWRWSEVVVLHAGSESPVLPQFGLTVLSTTRPPAALRSARSIGMARRRALVDAIAAAGPPGVVRIDGFLDDYPPTIVDRSAGRRAAATWWGYAVPAGVMLEEDRPVRRRRSFLLVLLLVAVALLACIRAATRN